MRARLGLLVSLALAAGLAAAPSDRAQVRGKLDRLTARGDLERALEQAAQARKSFPNDVGTRPDPKSPTGRRVNVSLEAPTAHERHLRRLVNNLDGFGTYAPIWLRFDGPIARQRTCPVSRSIQTAFSSAGTVWAAMRLGTWDCLTRTSGPV